MPDALMIDPLGRAVTLHDHTWFGHILKGHPDMRTLRTEVEAAIQTPLRICFSSSDPGCRIYYGSTWNSSIMVAVIGDVVGGFVRTAYRTAKIKGAVEW